MSYTRTYGEPPSRADATVPRFHMEAVEDPIASSAAGRPIFMQQERVQIIQPGNPNSPVLLVNDEHRQRWAEHYKRFRDGETSVVDGTPLEQWPFLRKVNVLELKAMGIHTVEQCAALSDQACQSIGLGGDAIRKNAAAYLDDAAAMSIVSEALAAKEVADSRIAALEMQLNEMRAIVDQLHKDNMARRDAPSAVETYVPPDLTGSAQTPRAGAGSSLDNLSVSSRPRGRRTEAAA